MTTEETREDLDKIRDDIRALRDDIAALGGTVRDLGLEKARVAGDRVRQAGEYARRRLNSAQETIEHEIEGHPLTSVLTSFGIGFVVGMLLDRRS